MRPTPPMPKAPLTGGDGPRTPEAARRHPAPSVSRRAIVFAVIMAATGLMGACSSPTLATENKPAGVEAQSTTRPDVVDVAGAQELIENGSVVIDVRSPSEFASGHLEGAVNVPLDVIGDKSADVAALLGGNKDAPVVVYCRSGRRSSEAAKILHRAGFTGVKNGGGLSGLRARNNQGS